MAECSLPESQELCLEITVLALVLARIVESRDRRMFGNKNSFSCQSNLPFCVDKIQPKTYLGLSQASHGIMAESGKVNPTKVLISMRLPRIQHVFRNPNSGTYNTQTVNRLARKQLRSKHMIRKLRSWLEVCEWTRLQFGVKCKMSTLLNWQLKVPCATIPVDLGLGFFGFILLLLLEFSSLYIIQI